jgi:hypothetical protein
MRGGGWRCSDRLVATVEIDDLYLSTTRKLHVTVYAMGVVFLHCLSLALIDAEATSL